MEQYTLPAAETLGLSALRAGAKAVWNVEAARDVSSPDRRVPAGRRARAHAVPADVAGGVPRRHAAGVPTVTTLHCYRYSCIVGTCVRDGDICEDCVGSRLKLPGIRHACYHDSRPATAALTLGLGLHRAAGTFHKAVTRYLTLTDFARRLMVRDGYPEDRIIVKPNSVPDPGVDGRRDGRAARARLRGPADPASRES